VLLWADAEHAPEGDFAANAVPNSRLCRDMVPGRGGSWEAVEEFALTYDGHAYWSDVAELGNRAMQHWTRDRALPTMLDELRGCLFYEERRWHHFGEDPHGRGAEFVWALLDSIRELATPVGARLDTRSPVRTPLLSAPLPPPPAPSPPLPAPPAPSALLPAPPASSSPAGVASSATPAGGPVRCFVDDDAGYLAWTNAHSTGYVVNASKTLSAKTLKLHKASCPSMVGSPGSTRSWTTSYQKCCSSDVGDLLDWCISVVGADPDPCQRCRP
ncbi:MAG: hypothetical protein ACYDD6_00935, partial [Acidimicrobiales bacterium]